jgi:DNA-binding NtrC family response regulator
MSIQRCRLLILDLDEHTLLALQRVLEDARFDTTITWDETEALHLIQRTSYDLILVGEHPPELTAERVLRDFASQGSHRPYLILGKGSGTAVQHLREYGVVSIVPKRDPARVLEQVRRHLTAYTARPLRAIAS